MKYAFIESDMVGEFPLAVVCRVLRVTQAGYHAWLKRPASAMSVARDALAELIKRVFAAFKGKYGAPRIYRELCRQHGLTHQPGLFGSAPRPKPVGPTRRAEPVKSVQRIPAARCSTSSQLENLDLLRSPMICCAAVALTPGTLTSASRDATLMSTGALPVLLAGLWRTLVHTGTPSALSADFLGAARSATDGGGDPVCHGGGHLGSNEGHDGVSAPAVFARECGGRPGSKTCPETP